MDRKVLDFQMFKQKKDPSLTLSNLVRKETIGNLTPEIIAICNSLATDWFACNHCFIGLVKTANEKDFDVYLLPCNRQLNGKVTPIDPLSFYYKKFFKSQKLNGNTLTTEIIELNMPKRLGLNGKIKYVRKFSKGLNLIATV